MDGFNYASVSYIHQEPLVDYSPSCNVSRSKRRHAEHKAKLMGLSHKKPKSPVLVVDPAPELGDAPLNPNRLSWDDCPVLVLDPHDPGYLPSLEQGDALLGELPPPVPAGLDNISSLQPMTLPPLSEEVQPPPALDLSNPSEWPQLSAESTLLARRLAWLDAWEPVPLSAADLPPPTPMEVLRTGVNNLHLSSEWTTFWTDLAEFFTLKMGSVLPASPPQGWREYICQHWQPSSEPDDHHLEELARGNFVLPTIWSPEVAPTKLSVSASESNTLPEGWFCLWDDMSALRRWQCFFSVRNLVENELRQSEPFLPAWSFQFLLVALLRGSALLRQASQALLQRLPDLARWHDVYVFSGGFLRRELVNHLRAGRVVPVCLMDTLALMWPQTHAVAFYEQVENWHTDHAILGPVFSALQGCSPSDFDLPHFQLKSHLLAGVDRIQGEDVYFRYHGCPRSLPKKLASIKQPRLLAAVQHWQQQHQALPSK